MSAEHHVRFTPELRTPVFIEKDAEWSLEPSE